MRPFGTIALCLLCACAPRYAPTSSATGKPVLVSGTRQPGSNTTEPVPVRSRYLETEIAGVLVMGEAVGFFIKVKLLESPTGRIVVRTRFESPSGGKPAETNSELPPDTNELLLSSPEPVVGVRGSTTYTVSISLLQPADGDQPIDTLVQSLRSYVDNTTGKVHVKNSLQAQ